MSEALKQWRHKNAKRVSKIQGDEYGYKTVCTSSVLTFFGIRRDSYRYAQTIQDAMNILRRNGFSVRSRKSAAGKNCTIGKFRTKVRSGKIEGEYFLVRVEGHAMVVRGDGTTVVDTDPRKVDRRRITHVYRVA
jgi:hypothetical protein